MGNKESERMDGMMTDEREGKLAGSKVSKRRNYEVPLEISTTTIPY